jgi:nickel-dependent lactate racemase
MIMIVELAYSRGTLPVSLPDDCDVQLLRKVPLQPLADPDGAVEQAYARPVGGPPLEELARGKSSACILICDITRPVPNGLILPPMIRTLLAAGIEASRITVLVATGLHRPNEGEELRELVGSDWVLDTVAVENHFARNDDDHVDMGVTATRATPVKLDRRFIDAELRIATGLVEPHFMAGFSGGRKVIAPGIAHEDTIRTFHSARFMEDPAAVQCNLDGNPLHEEQLEILRMLGGEVWAVNTVLDEQRNTTFVNFGEILQSHADAVDYVRRSSAVLVARKFNTVITSAAGFPLDATYYQTVKGMVMPMDILEPGADLIIAAACDEGIGSDEFRAAQERLVTHGADGFLAQILAKQFADVDEWQTEMQLKPMRVANIHLYTDGLNAADRAITGVNMIDSVEAAVHESMARSGDNAVAVIPEGPYVVPFYRPRSAAA